MKQTSYLLIFLFLFSCNSTTKEGSSNNNSQTDSTQVESLPIEELVTEVEPERKLYLNGIYEYDYPPDSEGMNENQYIAFQKNGNSVEAWYYGTSDEFDEAREGYLPGFFVSKITELSTNGDSVFFSISTGYNQCYDKRFPIGIVDTVELNKQYEKWFATGDSQSIKYAGKLDGLKLYIERFGETRTYRKSQNYFHIGIDNYDPTKCQTGPLLDIAETIDNLNEEIVFAFLNTFSVICEANVEFGEWSNELLFKALYAEPEMVIQVLNKNIDKLDTISIYKDIESPINDLIPIDSITTKIQNLEIENQVKNSILRRLESLN